MRLFIVANVAKPLVRQALDELLPWLRQRVEIVGIDEGCTGDWADLSADMILVLGGDGTLLAVARRLDGRQTPVMGIHFGRLGFLPDFTPPQFKARFDEIVPGRFLLAPRTRLQAS